MSPTALVATSTNGAKLLTGSKGSFWWTAGIMAKLVATKSSVWPSGGAFATNAVPMLPVAPARLSVTTPTFQRSASRGPSKRARMSAVVPGVYGTTI